MKKIPLQLVAMLLALSCVTTNAETLTEYVNACKTELGFDSIPELNCNDGTFFDTYDGGPDPAFDFMGYYRVTKDVDLTFACRVMNTPSSDGKYEYTRAVDLMIHRRDSGKTCFFSASPPSADGVSVKIVSPTDQTMLANGKTAAETYWETPEAVNNSARCVNCHIAGPYIASPQVVDLLGRFGLLNNGHITSWERGYYPSTSTFVGTTFGRNNANWESAVREFNLPTTDPGNCAGACHAMSNGIVGTQAGAVLATHIVTVLQNVNSLGLMPIPRAQKLNDSYRWMNLDIPDDEGGLGEWETHPQLKNVYPQLACKIPPKYTRQMH